MRRLLISLILFALVLPAADLSGMWTGLITTRTGDLQDLTFKFTQAGDTFKGKMYRDTASAQISDGKITGEQINFTVTVEEQLGNLFLDIKYLFSGTIKGTEIELTRERAPHPAIATNNNRGPQKQTFTLKRLL
jgi:hypothetical protein